MYKAEIEYQNELLELNSRDVLVLRNASELIAKLNENSLCLY